MESDIQISLGHHERRLNLFLSPFSKQKIVIIAFVIILFSKCAILAKNIWTHEVEDVKSKILVEDSIHKICYFCCSLKLEVLEALSISTSSKGDSILTASLLDLLKSLDSVL